LGSGLLPASVIAQAITIEIETQRLNRAQWNRRGAEIERARKLL
jgi:hypothetical protein